MARVIINRTLPAKLAVHGRFVLGTAEGESFKRTVSPPVSLSLSLWLRSSWVPPASPNPGLPGRGASQKVLSFGLTPRPWAGRLAPLREAGRPASTGGAQKPALRESSRGQSAWVAKLPLASLSCICKMGAASENLQTRLRKAARKGEKAKCSSLAQRPAAACSQLRLETSACFTSTLTCLPLEPRPFPRAEVGPDAGRRSGERSSVYCRFSFP